MSYYVVCAKFSISNKFWVCTVYNILNMFAGFGTVYCTVCLQVTTMSKTNISFATFWRRLASIFVQVGGAYII